MKESDYLLLIKSLTVSLYITPDIVILFIEVYYILALIFTMEVLLYSSDHGLFSTPLVPFLTCHLVILVKPFSSLIFMYSSPECSLYQHSTSP